MTNAEAQFNNSLRPRKPEGSLGRTVQDVHLDSHTAPELWLSSICKSSRSSYGESPRTPLLEGTSLHRRNNSVERPWGILSLFYDLFTIRCEITLSKLVPHVTYTGINSMHSQKRENGLKCRTEPQRRKAR